MERRRERRQPVGERGEARERAGEEGERVAGDVATEAVGIHDEREVGEGARGDVVALRLLDGCDARARAGREVHLAEPAEAGDADPDRAHRTTA